MASKKKGSGKRGNGKLVSDDERAEMVRQYAARWPRAGAVDALVEAESLLSGKTTTSGFDDPIERDARRALVHIVAALANDDAPTLEALALASSKYLQDFKLNRTGARHPAAEARFGKPYRHTAVADDGRVWRFGSAGFHRPWEGDSGDSLARDLYARAEAFIAVDPKRMRNGLTEWLGIHWGDLCEAFGLDKKKRPLPPRTDVAAAVNRELSRLQRLKRLEPVEVARATIRAMLASVGVKVMPGRDGAHMTVSDFAISRTRTMKRRSRGQ